VANARPDSFTDALFFSIETLATGYGEMYPGHPYRHVVAATEVVCGLGFTAILTGLTFVPSRAEDQADLRHQSGGGDAQRQTELRCSASDRGGRASVPNARSARPDARDISARDPHLCDAGIRFGMRYTDAATKEEDGTPVLDLTRAGALQPDIGDRQEQGWTERGEERE
jgi:Ion channel